MTTAIPTRIPTSAPLAALGAAAALGLLGDALFRNAGAPGINVLLWVAALAIAPHIAGHALSDAPAGRARWRLIAAGFASCLAIRDADSLKSLDALVILLALGLACLPWLAAQQRAARLRDVSLALVNTFAMTCAGPLLLARDTGWSALSQGRARRIGPILLGLMLAVPIVMVFSALFASADPVFQSFGSTLLAWNPGTVVQHVLIVGAFAWLAAGLLRAWLWKPILTVPWPADAGHRHELAIPAGIAVGAMLAVFLVFVAIQSRYLFGGEALIRSLAGLSYADYARQGFFQMVAATGLVVPVLYGADVLARGGNPRATQSLRALGGVQLLLTLCVCASATWRMALYIGAYGLTQDRIVASAILAWLAATIVIFANTVLRGRRERFCYGAITAGFITLGALNAASPDALIARVNLARAAEGKDVDDEHLARLNADAVPYLLAHASVLQPADRCLHLRDALRERWSAAGADWRGWNLARARAAAAARDAAIGGACGL